MSFKILRDVGSADLIRVQQNIKAAFDELGATKAAQPVTATGPTYRVTGAELAVFVNASGGPVTVILPPKATALVVLRSISSSTNSVTVSSASAKIDGAAMVTLAPLATLRLAFDGRAWWSV